ncbi:asparaginyl-tRNA synthetase [Yamadazyma tenuis]|nr:asparaginyl-tRNA synthetase [Yamadazyma tenuis]
MLEHPPAVGSRLQVAGHVKSIRKFKNIGFLDLSDGSTYKTLPIVFRHPDQVLAQYDLKVGQSLEISGDLAESKGVQSFEVTFDPADDSHHLKIIGNVQDSYPIQKKETSLQFLRSIPILRHRTSTLASVLRLRSFLEHELNVFFAEHSFTKVTPPMITSSDCEGGGEQFTIEPLNPKEVVKDGMAVKHEFFGKPAYLTVSTQLHLEVLAPSLNRVWTLTPCFRAEDSNTNRHLSEFWMLEAEISYISQLSQLTRFTEVMIRHLTSQLSNNREDVLNSRYNKADRELIEVRWNSILAENDWPVITYDEAINLINQVKLKGRSKGRLAWGDSISTEDEKWLAGDHFHSPVFITDYPKSQKPFYMPHSKNYNISAPTVACFDLIFPFIGELIGGSLREDNYEVLVAEMNRRNMDLVEMDWYLSTRLNGSVPHGGFGMGLERLMLYLSGLENVRDVVTFPRAPETCDC